MMTPDSCGNAEQLQSFASLSGLPSIPALAARQTAQILTCCVPSGCLRGVQVKPEAGQE